MLAKFWQFGIYKYILVYEIIISSPFFELFSWSEICCVKGCEREVAEAPNGASDEAKSESIMRLSWALVHSRQPEDVQRGIAMLEGQN